MQHQPIDFGGLAAALLERAHQLVPQWLPRGVERNGRWYIGDFDGADGESANVNLRTGQWIDNGAPDEDVGGDLLSLYRRVFGHHTMRDAALAVMRDMGWAPEGTAGPARGPEPRRAPPPGPPRHEAENGITHGERWTSVLPVPAHAPQPKRFVFRFKDKKADQLVELEAVQVWEWTFEGQRFGYTCRFERRNSSGEIVKDVLPLTWCEDTHDPQRGQRWHWKQWAAPRPLFVPAGRLQVDLPVVVVEGEKKAVAGRQLLGDRFQCVAWPGGAKAWSLADWSWLAGRTVYLWPDADAQREALTKAEREAGVNRATKPYKPLYKQAGWQAMSGIGQHLQAEHGCTVYLLPMDPPGTRPDGWDLADAVAEGWTADQVAQHLLASRPLQVCLQEQAAAEAAAGAGAAGAARAEGISTPFRAAAEEGEGADGRASRADWRRYLLCSDKGGVKSVRENIVTALDGRPDVQCPGIPECSGLIAFNEFTNTVMKMRATPWGTAEGEWLEADELQMGDWLVREHGLPSMARQALEEAVLIVGRRHAFHPLRERVEALRGRWDGYPRLDTWLRVTLLEEDDWDDREPLQQYLQRVGAWFVMAMVARVMTTRRRGSQVVCGPGTKFDYMLILEGPQGWGKSSLARILGGEYFSDTGLVIGEKDSLMNIQGIWIYEWGELDSLTRQEVTKVKQFISSSEDRFRATFDRRPAKYPRQVVFVGTTNEAHYLTDTTGNRRFWPVRVTRPPQLDWVRENLEQMLAEAVARVDAGERFWPSREEQVQLFDPQQRDRTVESSLESAIVQLLHDEDQKVPHGQPNYALLQEVSLQDLLDRVGYTIDKQTDAVVKKAGALMHMLGWEKRRLSVNEQGKRPRVYVRPANRPAARAVPGGSPPTLAATSDASSDDGSDDAPW